MNKVSVIIPAFNEEKNIGIVIDCIKKTKLVNEIIVVNNNSTDKTEEIAKSLGATTVFCKQQGKGYAMETGIKYASHNIILFVDADICNYDNKLVEKMIFPLLNNTHDFVKATFEREGGRITELVAKPLLELAFPELSIFQQPLSGIIAGKKEYFQKIKLEKDYGVDIGILIDMHKLNIRICEVNIGKIKNDSQDWKDLTHMARQVSKAILKRADIKMKSILD